MYRRADAVVSGTLLLGVVLAVFLFSGCAGSARRGPAEESAVEAEGWAPADGTDIEDARRRALADAQKNAVARISGVAISALTRVENAVTRREKVSARVEGFVSRYDILGQVREEGFLKIRIRAWVRREPASRAAPFASGETRVALAISGRGSQGEDWGASASSAIRGELAARGFDVAAAPDAVPDLMLRGEAGAVAFHDDRLAAFSSSLARVSLRAIDARSGIVVWEKTQEAAGLDLDASGAGLRAVEAAGSLLGRQAAGEIPDILWKRL